MPFEAQYDVVFSNATLHWIIDHAPVLSGVSNALQTGGRALLQMGGQGNAREIIAVLEELLVESPWARFFVDFEFPYGFHSPRKYRVWLERTQLAARRLELIPKDMMHAGVAGLQAWIRTTWLPYTSKIPLDRQDRFISEVAERFVRRHPPDADGLVHVRMVRLEADLVKRASASV
jgi:trans-aconitate methyltransferase